MKPILFNGEMVRAILEGRKTMTRRPANVTNNNCKHGFITPIPYHVPRRIEDHVAYSPFGGPGDRLWVKETFITGPLNCSSDERWVRYRATDEKDIPKGTRWKPSIHMSRWASRITLEITEVRVERVQEITEEDAVREGIDQCNQPNRATVMEFAKLWDSIYSKKYPWSSNPWVWVYTFRRI